ncbi:hypothetical protein AVEN_229768-1 [Araneus ventricosus]|uniref:Uncharacterized protein n=1 Tax=Araneus ventricosus TaxID=182803 RepID=A0A4Y2K8S3_ARAVE|nr:hypothetical protein AVEN_229768-1 [Araneus ventricosus]
MAPGSTLNDRPPRLHRALWSPITSGSCDDPPILPFDDPSSEIGPKSHTTTITVFAKASEFVLANLCGSFSSVNFAMLGSCDKIIDYMKISKLVIM